MLNLINDVIDTAKTVVSEVYRAYPIKILRGHRYIVVTPQGYSPEFVSSTHEVVSARLTYGVTAYDSTPEKSDKIIEELTDKLNKLGIQCTGASSSYQVDNNLYSTQATYSCIVDKRGMTYR